MGDRIRVGIIGTGGIFEGWGGGSGHLPAYPWVVKDAKVVALCDVNEENLKRGEYALKRLYEKMAREYESLGYPDYVELLRADSRDVRLYTDLDSMLESEEIDLADILTPCETHMEHVIKCLEAGCHVMCEKPLTRTWLEALEIVKAVKRTGRLFQYNEQQIYTPLFHSIRQLIRKGEIGELECVWISDSIGMPSWKYTKGGVGALLDLGSHSIIKSWFLIGFDYIPKRVRTLSPEGISIRVKEGYDHGILRTLKVEDDAHFNVEFEDPSTGRWVNAYIEASWSYRDSHGLRIVGSKGEIKVVNDAIEVIDVFGNSRKVEPWRESWLREPPPPAYNGFPQEIKAMLNCIKENARPLCDEKIAAESIAALNACYLSEAKGRTAIYLNEFKEMALKIMKEKGEKAYESLLKTLVEEALAKKL